MAGPPPSHSDGDIATDADDEIGDFLATLLAIEAAWSLLDEAEPCPSDDDAAAVALIDRAVAVGGRSVQLLVRAAGLLDRLGMAGRAHDLLEGAVADGDPAAPAQIALARSWRARGDLAQASRWLRGGMLRARPDGALLLELAAIEPDAAEAIVLAARSFRCRDGALAITAGRDLLAAGQPRLARIAFDMAYAAGARDDAFLIAYSDLLADPTMLDDPLLPDGPIGLPHAWMIATLAAQARLARGVDRAAVLAHARTREAAPTWVSRPQLPAILAEIVARREPFSWIRLGDGEARMLLHWHPALAEGLPAHEQNATITMIWRVWFGKAIETVPPDRLAALSDRFDQAVRNADLLGVPSAERLDHDAVHFGFLASLDRYLDDMLDDRVGRRFTDANFHIALAEADPFFATLLAGREFVGVIGPHPDLAARLQRHLGIGSVAHYDIPGELRLDAARDNPDRATHFPDIHDRLMRELTVPHRGALFLVAGGLLGKIYCDRIRELGGIALDIGAVADAWMGYNTRGGPLAAAMRWQLPA